MHRKSPAQLDREIAEVLSRPPGSSSQQPFYGLRVVPSEKAGYAPGKHVVQYKDGSGMWFDIGDPKSKAAADAALEAERSRVVTLASGARGGHAKKLRNISDVADALGYIPEGAVVRRAEETFSHYSTNELRREIQSLEDEFEMSGGRGIGLADRLDAARIALARRSGSKKAHSTIASGSGSISTVNEFWDLYEAELVKSILEAPPRSTRCARASLRATTGGGSARSSSRRQNSRAWDRSTSTRTPSSGSRVAWASPSFPRRRSRRPTSGLPAKTDFACGAELPIAKKLRCLSDHS